MSNRSKNFRRRTDDDDKEENDTNGGAPSSKATPMATEKSSSKATSSEKPKKSHQKLLSFVEDDENESPFSSPPKSSSSARPSKHTSSHKITSSKERTVLSSASVPSNVQPQAGQYTKEALLELQKNTRTLASSRSRPPASEQKPLASEPVIVLKGLVKPVLGNGKDDGDSNEDKPRTSEVTTQLKREKDDAERRLGLMGLGKEEALEGLYSDIPDQATINAIRAKRERLRQSRAAAPDYISLDGGSNHGAAEGLSDEEPEFQTRIAMLGEKTDDARKGVFEDVDERAVRSGHLSVEDDEDEEERIWEEEQFRKGLGKRMDEGSSGVSRNVTAVQSTQPQNYMYAAVSYSPVATVSVGSPTIGGAVGGPQGIQAMSISQQAEIAKQALQDNMKRLRETYGRTVKSLAVADENLATSLVKISTLEESLASAGDKYVFMQKLRDFIAVICEFLQEKAPYIEELEEQMQELLKKRASVALERRAADNDDEMMEVQAAVDAAMSVLGKGGGKATTVAAATSAAQAAAAAIKQQKNIPEMDEFGRDINLQKRLDMARRAEARQRRRARSDSKRMLSAGNNSYPQMEGESSTDDSENESEAYKSNRDQLLQVAAEIFGDAHQEYSQLSLVKEKFEKWKRLYTGSYRDAYMSLSIPAIFSPYVRLELLKWDPLHEEFDFYDMRWHSLLFDYGVPADGSDFSHDDVDADLIPGLVEKVALPILHHDLTHCWDMLSTKETRNAVSATSLIINYVPASSEALKDLIAAIRTRLAEAVSNLVVPAWSTVVMKAVPNAARIAAYRFGVALRLMRNICMWKDILAMQILEKLALDELLATKVLPHVLNLTSDTHDAVTRTERIIASLSGVWAGPSVTGERSRKLQPLVDFVTTLGKTLEKKHALGVAEAETVGLARRLKKMLVELNEYDGARAIARTFHLKEAV